MHTHVTVFHSGRPLYHNIIYDDFLQVVCQNSVKVVNGNNGHFYNIVLILFKGKVKATLCDNRFAHTEMISQVPLAEKIPYS